MTESSSSSFSFLSLIKARPRAPLLGGGGVVEFSCLEAEAAPDVKAAFVDVAFFLLGVAGVEEGDSASSLMAPALKPLALALASV